MDSETGNGKREGGNGRWSIPFFVAALSAVLTAAIVMIGYLLTRSPSSAPIEIRAPAPTPTRSPTTTPSPLSVYVTGAVVRPGVVQVHLGARVQDAISAAGGSTGDADLVHCNQAAPLVDGQHIHVPAVGEAPVGPNDEGGDDPVSPQSVNINTATAEELMVLPGVGEITAAKILAYRQEFGPFTRIEEIMDVPGIGEVKFDGFKEMIVVGP